MQLNISIDTHDLHYYIFKITKKKWQSNNQFPSSISYTFVPQNSLIPLSKFIFYTYFILLPSLQLSLRTRSSSFCHIIFLVCSCWYSLLPYTHLVHAGTFLCHSIILTSVWIFFSPNIP
jgi:hypothetical protein